MCDASSSSLRILLLCCLPTGKTSKDETLPLDPSRSAPEHSFMWEATFQKTHPAVWSIPEVWTIIFLLFNTKTEKSGQCLQHNSNKEQCSRGAQQSSIRRKERRLLAWATFMTTLPIEIAQVAAIHPHFSSEVASGTAMAALKTRAVHGLGNVAGREVRVTCLFTRLTVNSAEHLKSRRSQKA